MAQILVSPTSLGALVAVRPRSEFGGKVNTFTISNKRAVLAALLAIAMATAMLFATQGEADAGAVSTHVIGVEVDTAVNALNADPGDKGDVLMTVLVTKSRTQRPVSNVAASVARNNNGITLPARVEFSSLTVSAGGCSATPTEFTNSGNGTYNIRFVPFTGNASCDWLAGDYVYMVTIKTAGGAVLGQGLATLSL